MLIGPDAAGLEDDYYDELKLFKQMQETERVAYFGLISAFHKRVTTALKDLAALKAKAEYHSALIIAIENVFGLHGFMNKISHDGTAIALDIDIAPAAYANPKVIGEITVLLSKALALTGKR
jgi:hypothetical protein